MAKARSARIDGSAAVEAYLDKIPEPYNAALRALRAQIASSDPEAEEAMVYGVPGFRHGGKPLVCYAAFKSHCGFYPMSPALMDALADKLDGFRTAKGTIQFTPDNPLPAALVRRIVKARAAENTAASP
jgi:uncharacterized protein YdhG (YjbR/CyaY superfamily)